ncbi:MAG: 3-hydroxyacyl-ACP dehydratase [Deltaproteobacteria bacterium]|nr:3-hydroxyacyl-ACP dehydratase [Deltaproteobacteria bacterium]
MRFAGIDLGSRTIEVVVLEEGKVMEKRQVDSGFDPMAQAGCLLRGLSFDRIMATGYGRHLFEISFEAPTVTEIKAHAASARFLCPEAGTVLDIGGQDSKAIALSDQGKIIKFEMNDRCAAGTGKFLEIMAQRLGYSLDQFGEEALRARKDIQVSSMCTVFAESEVTSLLAKGEDRRDIALGLHRSVVRRAAGMLKRVSIRPPVFFAGGVARNPCIVEILKQATGTEILVPAEPQMAGALGAALLGSEWEKGEGGVP